MFVECCFLVCVGDRVGESWWKETRKNKKLMQSEINRPARQLIHPDPQTHIIPVQKSAVILQDHEHVPLLTYFLSSFFEPFVLRLVSPNRVFWNWLTFSVWLTAGHFFGKCQCGGASVNVWSHVEQMNRLCTRCASLSSSLNYNGFHRYVFHLSAACADDWERKTKQHLHR